MPGLIIGALILGSAIVRIIRQLRAVWSQTQVARWRKALATVGLGISVTGIALFLGIMAIGGDEIGQKVSSRIEFPVGGESDSAVDHMGRTFCALQPYHRIQRYSRDHRFETGWHVFAGGGQFRIRVDDLDRVHVFTARGSYHLVYDAEGHLLASGSILPADRSTAYAPATPVVISSPWYLSFLASPLYPILMGMAGGLIAAAACPSLLTGIAPGIPRPSWDLVFGSRTGKLIVAAAAVTASAIVIDRLTPGRLPIPLVVGVILLLISAAMIAAIRDQRRAAGGAAGPLAARTRVMTYVVFAFLLFWISAAGYMVGLKQLRTGYLFDVPIVEKPFGPMWIVAEAVAPRGPLTIKQVQARLTGEGAGSHESVLVLTRNKEHFAGFAVSREIYRRIKARYPAETFMAIERQSCFVSSTELLPRGRSIGARLQQRWAMLHTVGGFARMIRRIRGENPRPPCIIAMTEKEATTGDTVRMTFLAPRGAGQRPLALQPPDR